MALIVMFNNYPNSNSFGEGMFTPNSFQRVSPTPQRNQSPSLLYANYQNSNRGFPHNSQNFPSSVNTMPVFQPPAQYNPPQTAHPSQNELTPQNTQQTSQKNKVNAQAVLLEIQGVIEKKFSDFQGKVNELGTEVRESDPGIREAIQIVLNKEMGAISKLIEPLLRQEGRTVSTKNQGEDKLLMKANQIYQISLNNIRSFKKEKNRIKRLTREHKHNLQMLKDEEANIREDIARLNHRIKVLRTNVKVKVPPIKTVKFQLGETSPRPRKRRKPTIFLEPSPEREKYDVMSLLKARLKKRREDKTYTNMSENYPY